MLLRICLVVATATLAGMPAVHSAAAWLGLRLLAGVTSALISVIAVGSLLGHLRQHSAHLTGWAVGGVGAGIAMSGPGVPPAPPRLPPGPGPGRRGRRRHARRRFPPRDAGRTPDASGTPCPFGCPPGRARQLAHRRLSRSVSLYSLANSI
ncbi:YbfB/YjiJ family MFS transporter [Streptomyces sp. NPDC003480]